MTQPNVNADSRFTLRVDWPDVAPSDDEAETLETCDEITLEGKLDALAHYTDLDRLTVGESPMIVEVRRIK